MKKPFNLGKDHKIIKKRSCYLNKKGGMALPPFLSLGLFRVFGLPRKSPMNLQFERKAQKGSDQNNKA